MGSNSIDSLIKLSAPSAIPVAAASARDDAEQFDSYLRQAAKAANAPEPAIKPQSSAPPAKEATAGASANEQGPTASSDDDSGAAEFAAQGDATEDEAPQVVESDELVISAVAAEIVVGQAEAEIEVAVGGPNAESSEVLSTGVPGNAEGGTQSTDQKKPAAPAKTVFTGQVPAEASRESNEVTTIPIAQDGIDAVHPQNTSQVLGEGDEAAHRTLPAEESQPSLVSIDAEGASIAASDTAVRIRTDSQSSEKSVIAKDSHLSPISAPTEEMPIAAIKEWSDDSGGERSLESQGTPSFDKPSEVSNTVLNEIADLGSDANGLTGGEVKSSGVSLSTSNAQLGNSMVSQATDGVSGHVESHAARTEGESQTPTIDRTRFVQRVSNAFRAAQQNDGHIQLRLSPPELGQLRIEIAVRNGVLSANLETETADARRVLLDNLPALRHRLAEQDIRIDKFEVDIRREGGQPDGQAGAQDRQAEQQSHRASMQNRIRAVQTSEVTTTRVPRTQAKSVDVGLDVRI